MDDNDPYVGRTPGDRHPDRDPSDCYRERVAAQDEIRMQRDQDHCVLMAMLHHGGGFAKGLAQAGLMADDDNLARIKRAFPELWGNYLEMSNARR